MQISALGIAWYRREDYPRVLETMVDANLLPKTFDAWQRIAEKAESRFVGQGMIVVRAPVDPYPFLAWCRAKGMQADAKARAVFGAEKAVRRVRQ
jgi:hypothetical protein